MGEFWRFTKSKVIITLLLMVMAVLQVVLPLVSTSPSSFSAFRSQLFTWILIIPVLARAGLIVSGAVSDTSAVGNIVMLVVALFYSYILACLLVWLWHKIFRRETSVQQTPQAMNAASTAAVTPVGGPRTV